MRFIAAVLWIRTVSVPPEQSKIDIARYIKAGQNSIVFECDFVQSDAVYENIRKSWHFESEKNKLTYDMEIESIYLVGSFGVCTDGTWGFLFFSGELILEGALEVPEGPAELVLDLKGVNAIRIECGDFKRTVLTEDRISLEGIDAGRHGLKLTLINNLRNMMGPHHLELGEFISVGSITFYKEECVWRQARHHHRYNEWNDDYCFVTFGRGAK